MAAKYYRLAEENGNKILGNTWYGTAQSLFCVAQAPPSVPILSSTRAMTADRWDRAEARLGSDAPDSVDRLSCALRIIDRHFSTAYPCEPLESAANHAGHQPALFPLSSHCPSSPFGLKADY